MTRLFVWAVALLLLGTAEAPAGVIPWQYSSTLTASDGTDQVSAGALDIGTVVVVTVSGSNPLTPASGNLSFGLGGLGGSTRYTPDISVQFSDLYKASINITDGDSGASGSVTFFGHPAAFLIGPPVHDRPGEAGEPIDFSTMFITHDDFLELGHHRYDVHVGDDFSANVVVSEMPNAPEPATLVTAVIGMCVVGAGAVRRRLRRRQ